MALKRVFVVNKMFPAAGLDLLKNKVDLFVSAYGDDDPETMGEIQKHIKGVDGLLWFTKHKLTKDLLDMAGPQLKVVTTMSAGVDQVDVAELRKRGIPLGNTPRVLDNAVADIAVGLMVAAARRFKEGIWELEQGEWKVGLQWKLGQDITGSTVGIVGLGNIGQAIVRRLKGFDVGQFLYSGRTEKPEAKSLGAERVSLKVLLKNSDFVILACPLTAETRHLINADAFNKMRMNATLVNIARGEVVDQGALVKALQDKKIHAAGLDVVTPEPLPKDHPLVKMPNCFVIPHMGSATNKTRDDMAKISASNILLGLEGTPLMCSVP